MFSDEDWDFILSMALDDCNKSFHKTKEAENLKEKREKMEQECKSILNPNLIAFLDEYACVLLEIEGAKIEHAYKQGFSNCIQLLKRLKIL